MDGFIFQHQTQALGRMPSCKMWLDHPSCSGHQLELRAEAELCLGDGDNVVIMW